MTQHEQDPAQDDTRAQSRPQDGVAQDPSTNTSPPSNPEVDREALEKGKEKLDSVVSW